MDKQGGIEGQGQNPQRDPPSIVTPAVSTILAALQQVMSPDATELPAGLKNLGKVYQQVKEQDLRLAETIVQQIAAALYEQHRRTPKERSRQFQLAALQNWMVYGDDKTLYKDVLATGMAVVPEGADEESWEGFSMQCRNNRANTLRREGNFEEAEREFHVLYAALSAPREKPVKDGVRMGVVQYELGYIDYLRGELKPAQEWFCNSANSDAGIGNPIGELISRSLHYKMERMRGTKDRAQMRTFFDEAIKVFKQRQKNDATFNATRWVMNCNQELFDIAIEEGNIAEAQRLLDTLDREDPFLNDPNVRDQQWLKELYAKKRARLAALQNDLEHALAHWSFLPMTDDAPQPSHLTKESLAREYLEAGRVLVQLGRQEEARNAWERGNTLDPNNGNKPWQTLIREELTRLSPST